MRALYVLAALNLADGTLTALWIRWFPHLEWNPLFRALVETYGVGGSFLVKAALSGTLVLRAQTARTLHRWEIVVLRGLSWVYAAAVAQQVPIVIWLALRFL
ncbi:MAG: DUF5658 family protein [Armatimonadota bacterium]|nr:DUF5658 family protein [Armatimonadota bacterium]MDR7444346.1 DUF5658 family protein [Armatimonadota bacterium]MDR7569663.1 DUF5658 family protein [Armatimonadota bacterium]MDR7614833.1 DUF5658 family protein [Armatimonadota bacterium]